MAIFSIRARGPLDLLLRVVALVLLLGLAVLGFWKSSQRSMERINAHYGLADEAKALDQAERERVQEFIAALRKSYGIEARVQVATEAIAPPQADGKTLFVGLSPRDKTALVVLPPLVARALGPDFARELETRHFPFYFEPGRKWQKGLLLALDLIESRLAALGTNDTTNGNATSGNKETK